MKAEDVRFEVQLHLTTGNVVTYHIDRAYVDDVLKRNWGWPVDFPEDQKGFSVVFSEVAQRVAKGTGYIQATDVDDRLWRVKAEAVIAMSVKPVQKTAPRPIGFNPLVSEHTAQAALRDQVVGIRAARRKG